MFFDEFYYVSSAFLRGELRVTPRAEITDVYKLARAEDMPDKPLIFDWHMGSKITDFLPTTYAVLHLVSKKVIELFDKFSVTGWTTYPVVVYNKDGSEIEGFSGLAITGHCGPLDNSRCVQKLFPPPSPAAPSRLSWVGYYFDEDSWDGSDIFVPQGTGIKICTKKVKEIIKSHKITNFDFESITEVERADLPKAFIKKP